MPVLTILIVIIVVGVLLWLVNLIPMHPTVRSIFNTVVIILLVVWLLQVFGLLDYLRQLRV